MITPEYIQKQIAQHRKEIRFHQSEVTRWEAELASLQKIDQYQRSKIKKSARLLQIEKDKKAIFQRLKTHPDSTIKELVPYLNRLPDRNPKFKYDLDKFRSYLLPELLKDGRFRISQSTKHRHEIIINKDPEYILNT